MEFEQFKQKSEGLIDKIKAQNPLAILQFGSSTRAEDYIPEVSDLDLIVISETPIADTENDLGFEYFPNTPTEALRDYATASPFMLNAINNGKIVYDPQGFVEAIKNLTKNGLKIKPTKNTIYQINQSIGNQLSSAMNRYFQEREMDENENALLRNVHSTVREIGIMQILAANGTITDGYTQTHSALKKVNPAFAEQLRMSQEILINHQELSPERKGKLLIERDDLGSVILDTEKSYMLTHPDQFYTRFETNRLIEHQQSSNNPLEKTLAVRINNIDFSHLILGTQKGKGHLFGFLETNKKPRFISQELSNYGQLNKAYSQIGIFR
ncbi:hypothetical protein J4474_02970 [Candidatus Pacearchaeota archaeon]|nr:hypothetical protein [Candidatus Pacearchaeota archaeon]